MPIARTLAFMRGTREEPVEVARELEEDLLMDRFVVFIDGTQTFFESADAYVKWAGKSLQLPLARNLAARMRTTLHSVDEGDEGDEEADDDDGAPFEQASSFNWGDEDEGEE